MYIRSSPSSVAQGAELGLDVAFSDPGPTDIRSSPSSIARGSELELVGNEVNVMSAASSTADSSLMRPADIRSSPSSIAWGSGEELVGHGVRPEEGVVVFSGFVAPLVATAAAPGKGLDGNVVRPVEGTVAALADDDDAVVISDPGPVDIKFSPSSIARGGALKLDGDELDGDELDRDELDVMSAASATTDNSLP